MIRVFAKHAKGLPWHLLQTIPDPCPGSQNTMTQSQTTLPFSQKGKDGVQCFLTDPASQADHIASPRSLMKYGCREICHDLMTASMRLREILSQKIFSRISEMTNTSDTCCRAASGNWTREALTFCHRLMVRNLHYVVRYPGRNVGQCQAKGWIENAVILPPLRIAPILPCW
jgi:hypothetical protein